MIAPRVFNMVLPCWEIDHDIHVMLREGGKTVWEGPCDDMPAKYHMRFAKSISMTSELYVNGEPEVEYVIVTMFTE